MSMISELVDKLRTEAKSMSAYGPNCMSTLLMKSADAIEMLSEKARERVVTNADAIRNMTDDELCVFIRKIYLAGKRGNGFDFCDYNLEKWISQKM